MRGHVAGAAGIGVEVPGAAHVVPAFEHGEVLDPLLLEADRHPEAREAAADDRDVDVGLQAIVAQRARDVDARCAGTSEEVTGIDPARLGRLRTHFDRYVEDGRLPGWLVVVHRDGETHLERSGRRDLESDLPVDDDTLWRIYSMTKPITSVAAMMLWEEGHFELKDPVSRWLPEFADMRVFRGGAMAKVVTEPALEPITVWNLLTHTSGLTYGFHHAHPVDAIYRAHGFEWGSPPGLDLAGCCAEWAQLPLLFQPGTEWNYGVSTDVLGRVIEVISGQSLDEFLAARVLGPLGMIETGFYAPEADHGRLAALYTPDPETGRATRSPMSVAATQPPEFLSGGGGLVSRAQPTTCASPGCSSAGARSTACGCSARAPCA